MCRERAKAKLEGLGGQARRHGFLSLLPRLECYLLLGTADGPRSVVNTLPYTCFLYTFYLMIIRMLCMPLGYSFINQPGSTFKVLGNKKEGNENVQEQAGV